MKKQEAQPQELTFAVVERAVLYARVSSDDSKKDGRNLDGQIEMGREYAQEPKRNYNIIAELKEDDRGASGAEIDLPKLNEIREMARAGLFDVLVVRELDRLSRSLAKQLIVEEELNRAGVRVEYVLAEYDNTPEGRLNKHIRATIAEYEREKITERMTRGRRNAVKNGSIIVNGRPPYGYTLEQEINEKGEVIRRWLEINETEAKIVRQIFEWYIEGDTYDKIRDKLSELKIPTPADTKSRKRGPVKKRGRGEWSKQTVRYILNNRTYIGQWQYGKSSKSQAEPITLEVEPIISLEVWDAAEQRKAYNRANSTRTGKYEYLLAQRVKCQCGYKMTGHPKASKGKYLYLYYGCPARGNDRHRKCKSPLYRADRADTKVWNWIEEVMTNRQKLEDGIAGYQAEIADVTNPLLKRLNLVEDLIAQQEVELDEEYENLNLLKNSPRAKAKKAKDIEQIEKTLDGLQAERRELAGQIDRKALTEEQKQTIFQFADMISADLEMFRKDFPSRRMLVELVDVQVVLYVEDGIKKLDVSAKIGKKTLEVETNNIRVIGTSN